MQSGKQSDSRLDRSLIIAQSRKFSTGRRGEEEETSLKQGDAYSA